MPHSVPSDVHVGTFTDAWSVNAETAAWRIGIDELPQDTAARAHRTHPKIAAPSQRRDRCPTAPDNDSLDGPQQAITDRKAQGQMTSALRVAFEPGPNWPPSNWIRRPFLTETRSLFVWANKWVSRVRR